MSRAFPAGMKVGLAARPNGPGWLLELTPVGLPVARLTTIGADFTHDGDLYLGTPGFVFGGARFTASGEASLEVDIPLLDSGPVTPDQVTRKLWQGAAAVVRPLDFEAGEVGPPLGFKWVVGRTQIGDDGAAVFDIRDAWRVRRELVLKVVGPGCRTHFGHPVRCGVDVLGLWTDAVTVATVTDAYSFTVTGARGAAVDDFFARGAIRFETGDNVGRACTVRRWVQASSTVILWEPLRAGLAPGDTALIHAGCDKTRATCHSKFSNNRYQGFDHLPDDDASFAVEVAEQPESPPSAGAPVVAVEQDPPPARRRRYYQWTTGRWIYY